jgi:putative ABC transport system permease protein
VALLGQTVVTNLFPDVYSVVGRHIRIGNSDVEVIGILESIGSISMGSMDSDNLLIMPISTVHQRLIGERTTRGDYPLTSIMIQARDKSLVDAVAGQIRQTLRNEHDIIFNDDDDFTIMTQNDLLESVGSVTGILTLFLGIIAGISLIVGGIGIMNIMLVTVTERTNEIGIRKAVGARRTDILTQFLTESVVLALVGGAAGVGAALLLTRLIGSMIPNLDITIQTSSVLLGVGVSVAIGLFFGIYPANRAAELHPIDALHYE